MPRLFSAGCVLPARGAGRRRAEGRLLRPLRLQQMGVAQNACVPERRRLQTYVTGYVTRGM